MTGTKKLMGQPEAILFFVNCRIVMVLSGRVRQWLRSALTVKIERK